MTIMDKFPICQGHALVISRRHTDSVYEMDHAEYHSLMQDAKRMASAMMQVYSPKRIALVIVGCDVSHAHVHLVPVERFQDLHEERPPDAKVSSLDVLQVEAERIRDAYRST
jgi:histidine triad (HIT) family protein